MGNLRPVQNWFAMFMKKPTFSEHVNVKSLCMPLAEAQHKNSDLVSTDFD